jgi:hypothetical protein
MKAGGAGLIAVALAFSSPFAVAGTLIDAATRAEALRAQGKTVQALEELQAAMDKVCEGSPLAFRKVVIVDSSEGYGKFVERADKTFKPDEKLLVYVEPVCLGAGADGAIGFKADLSVANTTGQVLGEAKDVFSVSTSGADHFSATLSFEVPYLRPGEYKATFAVRDSNSPRTGSFEVPFAIGLPTAN